jgi:hypothetical protein
VDSAGAGVDVLFLRHDFWPRLGANVGMVLVAAYS